MSKTFNPCNGNGFPHAMQGNGLTRDSQPVNAMAYIHKRSVASAGIARQKKKSARNAYRLAIGLKPI